MSATATTSDICAEAFSFHAQGTIRLSTLHSSKAFDLPVVLVCVGMTRAMDNLNVFTVPEPKEVPLRDLVAVFREQGNHGGE